MKGAAWAPQSRRPGQATVLFVTPANDRRPSGGREMLSALHRQILEEVYGNHLVVLELPRARLRGPRSGLAALQGNIDGVTLATITDVLRIIRTKAVAQVVLDGSNLGELARAVKAYFPQVQVTTLFHNVEARFFSGALLRQPRPRALVVLAANYVAERKAVRWSDRRVCLTPEDSADLARLYGSGATDIAPMAVRDTYRPDAAACQDGEAPYALFVGGSFYANEAGISWFAERVAPRITLRTRVVGRGMERLRQRLERAGNVEVLGEVADLAPHYRGALVVVAPVFEGSGMKTKVAEAMMHGKYVVGTPHAFAGYGDVAAQVGRVCAAADDFVNTLAELQRNPPPAFDPGVRALYEARYSYDAARVRLANILLGNTGRVEAVRA